jgi:DNA-binding NtrC family response regulator
MPSTSVLAASSVPNRALIVDDEAGIAALLVAQLAAAGWETVVATRYHEAVQAVSDKTRTLDLVFLDLRLPDGDGMSLLPLIQDRNDRPDVVIITGFADEHTYLEAIRAGTVIDFLNKPMTSVDVSAALRRKSIRERARLGYIGDRFERVDDEFRTVHQEIDSVRGQIADLKRLLVDGAADRSQRAGA